MTDPSRTDNGSELAPSSSDTHQNSQEKTEGQSALGVGSEPELEKTLEDMPPDIRRTVKMAMMGFSSGPGPHPLFDKFNDEHVHKFLDYAQQDEENKFRIKCSNRWFVLGYTGLGVAFFVFLIVFLLPDNEEILLDLLKVLVAFAGGLGGGYGLKSYFEGKK